MIEEESIKAVEYKRENVNGCKTAVGENGVPGCFGHFISRANTPRFVEWTQFRS